MIKSWWDELLPPELIFELARQSQFLIRLRKLNPLYLVYILVFGLSAHNRPMVSEIHRHYQSMDDTRPEDDKIRQQSISKRINTKMVDFFRLVLLSCIDRTSSSCSARLCERYQAFRTIFIQDSTVIRIHSKLFTDYPSTRSRDGSGGMKISLLYNAVTAGPETISIVPERTHDIKAFKIGPWVKGTLLLMDLGYYAHWNLTKIIEYGGSFVVRAKKSAKPTVMSVITSTNPVSSPEPGTLTLWKFLETVPKQGTLDLMVQIRFNRRKYRNKSKRDFQMLRVVCFWNEEKSQWHTYMTNLSSDQYSMEEISVLYRFRWEIELLFKELKSDYELGKLLSSRSPVVLVNVYAALIRLTVSRHLYKNMVKCEDEIERQKFSHTMWSRVFSENCAVIFCLIHDEIFCTGSTAQREDKLYSTLRYQSKRCVAVPLNRSEILQL
jgi:putative transposase